MTDIIKSRISVIGCGMIGPDICANFLLAGFPVAMIGRSDKSISKGMENLKKDLKDYQEAGIISSSEMEHLPGKIAATTSMSEGLENADFIFEAVSEDLSVKQDLFAEVESLCPGKSILCSSTSGLPPEKMSFRMKNPRRLLVTHFWNPAHLVPLVEVVTQEGVDSSNCGNVVELLELIGKVPVVLSKNIAGHIGNRLQHAIYREALHLIEENIATPEQIDKIVLHSFGLRFSTIGVMEYFDSCGLDLQEKVQGYLFNDLCCADSPQKILKSKVENNNLGPKTGRGFYDWSKIDMEDFRQRKNRRFIEYIKQHRNTTP